MESARGGGKGWGGGEGQEVGGTSEKVGGSRDKELKGLGEENDADGQVKWHLELTETFFCCCYPSIYVTDTLTFPFIMETVIPCVAFMLCTFLRVI